jgi:hypothetical protein
VVVIGIVGVVLTLIVFHAVVFHPRTVMVGGAGSEHMSGAWVFTWSQRSVVEDHRFPLVIDGAGKSGRSLLYPLSVATTFVTLPLYPLLDIAARYNAAMLFNFLLALFGAFALFRYLGSDDWVALPGATMFALSPFLTSHWNAGPPEGAALGWLPLALLAAEALRRGDRVPLHYSAIKGVAIAVAFAGNPYYGIFAALGSAYLTLTHGATRWWWRLLDTAVMTVVSTALMLPLALAIRYSLDHPDAMFTGYSEQFSWDLINVDNADLLAFFLPLKEWARPAHYLGIVAWAAALWAAVRVRPARRWMWLGLAGLVFACGGTLRIAGTVPTLGDRIIALPARYLCDTIPPFTFITHPFRTIPLITLTLGAAIALLLARVRDPRLRYGASAALVLAIAFDSLVIAPSRFPIDTQAFRVPEYYRGLADDPDEYAVLDVPMGHHDATLGRYLISHLYHRKRIPYDIEGKLIPLEDAPDAFGFVNSLNTGRTHFTPPGEAVAPYKCQSPRCGAIPVLAERGYRYVVLHRYLVDEATAAELKNCIEPCVDGIHHEDDEVTVYEIPGS